MKLAVIVPQIVVHHMDPHTGIPFMPHVAAYMAAVLRKEGFQVQALDSFGMEPHVRELAGHFMLLGLSPSVIAGSIDPSVKICYIYCRTVAEYLAIERLCIEIKKRRPDIKICLFENAQAVTSFSLKHVAGDLLKNCAEALLLGEPERRVAELTRKFLGDEKLEPIPGLAYLDNGNIRFTREPEPDNDLDSLPLPDWENYPLHGYWLSGFTHGPRQKKRFLPLLTSRGCPFQCKFCIAPEINNRWRARSPVNVVDEMEHFLKSMQVSDFHISDLNPGIDEKRLRDISKEIISRKLTITWKLVQGTKIDILGKDTIELMGRAGCNYISFSPETGSGELLKAMRKPFNFEHALDMVRVMDHSGIRSQACFIAGLPGEDEAAQNLTRRYIKKLVKNGLDEIGVFGFAPIPGSELSRHVKGGAHYSECTFNPSWREDYKQVAAFRLSLYLTFFLCKLAHPLKVSREIRRFLNRRFETKMEMSLYKLLKLYTLKYFPFLLHRLRKGSKT